MCERRVEHEDPATHFILTSVKYCIGHYFIRNGLSEKPAHSRRETFTKFNEQVLSSFISLAHLHWQFLYLLRGFTDLFNHSGWFNICYSMALLYLPKPNLSYLCDDLSESARLGDSSDQNVAQVQLGHVGKSW